MAENTKIQWATHTFNGWLGCTKVGVGCQSCYAEAFMDKRYGRVRWGPEGTRSRTKTWGDPIRWNKTAVGQVRVFASSLCDVFEDWQGSILNAQKQELWVSCLRKTFPWRNRYVLKDDCRAVRPAKMADLRKDLFSIIDGTPALTWMLLTKRPENIIRMWPDDKRRGNVWLGMSAATQQEVDTLPEHLIACRRLSRVQFLSLEPQVEFVDASSIIRPKIVSWIIQGGESKQGDREPRPFDLSWAWLLKDQCVSAGVPLFIKQLGSAAVDRKVPVKLKDSHGGDQDEWPEGLRLRQFPEV